jgi:ketosteroid isomerase-like protein
MTNKPDMNLSESKLLQLAERWLADWNQHNLEAILSHYSNDIIFTSPLVSKILNRADGTIQGKAPLQDYFARGLQTYPDLQFELIQVLVGVNSVVIYYHSINKLLAAEFMQVNPSGSIVKVNAHYNSLP